MPPLFFPENTMRLSAILGYLSARYMELGDSDRTYLLLQDSLTNEKQVFEIKGVEIAPHSEDNTKMAIGILAKKGRRRR